MFDNFVQVMIALVAIGNVVPILPIVSGFTQDLSPKRARAYQLRAILEANAVAWLFMLGAPFVLRVMSLGIDDLRIAGGVILLTFATHDILFSRIERKQRQTSDEDDHQEVDLGPAVAPLGIPIMVGPGTLCVLMILAETRGTGIVTLAMAVNLLLNCGCILASERVLGWMGEGLSRAVGKVMGLVLAALGAGMLRAGLQATFDL